MIHRSLEAFEQRQNKILETCEEIQNRTSQILKEATDKWRLARAMHAQQADLERKICAVEGIFFLSTFPFSALKKLNCAEGLLGQIMFCTSTSVLTFPLLVLSARAQKLESVGTEDVAAVREQNESLHHQLELVTT